MKSGRQDRHGRHAGRGIFWTQSVVDSSRSYVGLGHKPRNRAVFLNYNPFWSIKHVLVSTNICILATHVNSSYHIFFLCLYFENAFKKN